MSTETDAATRGSAASVWRRVGFGLAVLVNVILLWLTLVWPGWQAVPILTPEAANVLPVFVGSLIAGIVVNVLNAVIDSRALRAIGDIVTSALAFAVALQLWEVFPFDFGVLEFGRGLDWELLTRGFLGFVMAVTVIAVIAQLVVLGRLAFGSDMADDVVGPH